MATETETTRDVRHDWLQCRVQSSLNVNEDAFRKVLTGDSKHVFSSCLVSFASS